MLDLFTIFCYTVFNRQDIGGVPAVPAETLAACVMRFLCAFFSGVVIWGVYAPEGMAPETIVAVLALCKIMPKLFAATS